MCSECRKETHATIVASRASYSVLVAQPVCSEFEGYQWHVEVPSFRNVDDAFEPKSTCTYQTWCIPNTAVAVLLVRLLLRSMREDTILITTMAAKRTAATSA